MDIDIFKVPQPRFDDGIYRVLDKRPRVPPAQASNFLPLTAKLYEPLWRERSLSIITSGSFNVGRELALMLEWINPTAHQVFLDAACSAGLYTRTLLKHEASVCVHAVDFSLPFLEKARDYAKRDHVSPILVHADVNKLPYRDTVFDGIVCGGSLNEFVDLEKSLSEFSRVLKPKGKLWLMYVAKAEGWTGKLIQGLLRPSGIRFIKPENLKDTTRKVNLQCLKAQYRAPIAMALFERY